MEVSGKTFREVEFREKMRGGYHPDDVDQFLDQMAAGVDAIHERLRQTTERAQRAEAAAAEAGSSDETLRRTLVLAQRTADMAVKEAREQASRILASAEQQAQAIVNEAEDRARRLHGEALADVHAELAKLEATRAQAQQEVDALSRWATEHRAHLITTLHDALAMVDRAGMTSPPPSSSPVEVPFAAPRAKVSGEEPLREVGEGRMALPPVAAPPEEDAAPSSSDDATRVSETIRVGEAARVGQATKASEDAGPPTEAVDSTKMMTDTGETAPAGDPAPSDRNPLTEPDEEALDNFFDDDEFDDEPRFGGRLRRRR